MSLKYGPTDKMWANILTKPMQQKAFRDVGYIDDMMVTVTDKLNQKLTEGI